MKKPNVSGEMSPKDQSHSYIDIIAEHIINALDQYARNTDPLEYGLPCYDVHMDKQKEIVKALLDRYITH